MLNQITARICFNFEMSRTDSSGITIKGADDTLP